MWNPGDLALPSVFQFEKVCVFSETNMLLLYVNSLYSYTHLIF